MFVSTVNPFVASALSIITDHWGDSDLSEEALIVELGKREPRLSPLNLSCATRQALRLYEISRTTAEPINEPIEAAGPALAG